MSVKILIVDDERDVRESTAMVIQSLGYTAVTCGEASEILDTVEREHPDIILQDLKMPSLNVSGLVASLRSNAATADIPLVFFSAQEDLATTAARYDVWGYLSKPFDAQELEHLLLQILGASRHPPAPPTDRDLQRDLRLAFHDYWNLLAAVGNYLAVLKSVPGLVADAQHAVHGLDEILLKLETKTDRLRSYLLSLAGQTSGVGATEPADQRGKTDPRRGPPLKP